MDLQADHPFLGDVTAPSVISAHARGRKVFVYTVNDPPEMRRLIELGVDGLFTDDPARALEILAMK
jgi:glycerophosphoryl diester phosphodiesterase